MPTIQWNEPASFKRNYPAPTPLLDKACHIRFGVVVVLVLLLRAIIHAENPTSWFAILLIALLTGAVFGYLVPIFLKYAPNIVVVSDKGISRNVFCLMANILPAVEYQFWDWQTFTSAQLETIIAGSQKFRVLNLQDPSGQSVIRIALGPKVDEAALRAKLAEHSKQLRIA